jgi:8-oxo-dGTP pyrophosphatase MutT (NUDIX family)
MGPFYESCRELSTKVLRDGCMWKLTKAVEQSSGQLVRSHPSAGKDPRKIFKINFHHQEDSDVRAGPSGRGLILPPDEAVDGITGVGIWVLMKVGVQWYAVVGQRGEVAHGKGQYANPGGEHDQPHPRLTARKEVLEETGLHVDPADMIPLGVRKSYVMYAVVHKGVVLPTVRPMRGHEREWIAGTLVWTEVTRGRFDQNIFDNMFPPAKKSFELLCQIMSARW